LIFTLSVIPLSFLDHKMDHPKFEMKGFIRSFRQFPKTFLFLNLYGIKGFVFHIVLPISIYLIGSNLSSLGIIVSAIALINIIFSLWLGKKIDRFNPKTIVRIGAIVTFAFMLVLGLLNSDSMLIYISLISGLISILIDLPIESNLYENAKKSGSPLTFLAFKEFSFFIGRTSLFLILILMALGMERSYFLGAISSLVFLFF